jgi:hypothetical protein
MPYESPSELEQIPLRISYVAINEFSSECNIAESDVDADLKDLKFGADLARFIGRPNKRRCSPILTEASRQ